MRAILVGLVLLLVGCTGSAFTVGRKTLTPIDGAVLIAHQEWQGVDKARDAAIVTVGKASGKTNDVIKLELASWRAIGDKVELAFKLVVQALHAARAAIDAAEAGAAGALPVAEILRGVAAVLRGLVDALAAAGVTIPPVIAAFLGGAP